MVLLHFCTLLKYVASWLEGRKRQATNVHLLAIAIKSLLPNQWWIFLIEIIIWPSAEARGEGGVANRSPRGSLTVCKEPTGFCFCFSCCCSLMFAQLVSIMDSAPKTTSRDLGELPSAPEDNMD